jgi:hypothetical protein
MGADGPDSGELDRSEPGHGPVKDRDSDAGSSWIDRRLVPLVVFGLCLLAYAVGFNLATRSFSMSDGACSIAPAGNLGLLLIAGSLIGAGIASATAEEQGVRLGLGCLTGIGLLATLGLGALTIVGCWIG